MGSAGGGQAENQLTFNARDEREGVSPEAGNRGRELEGLQAGRAIFDETVHPGLPDLNESFSVHPADIFVRVKPHVFSIARRSRATLAGAETRS